MTVWSDELYDKLEFSWAKAWTSMVTFKTKSWIGDGAEICIKTQIVLFWPKDP